MSKVVAHIFAQYSENYGTEKAPIWKLKGPQIFSLNVEVENFMYAEEACIEAIKTLLKRQSNDVCRFDYVSHELIFHEVIPLSDDLFQKEVEKELFLEQVKEAFTF